LLSRREILTAPLIALAEAQSGPQIRFDGKVFRVSGWPPPGSEPKGGWSSLFAVYAATGSDPPPVTGNYAVQDGDLTFTPRYPLSVKTRAVLRITGKPPVEAMFTPPTRSVNRTTRVEQVYPSANVLPANLLRFYIQFSGPMRRGDAWNHIRLLDRSAKPLDLPFLELDQELWDGEARRLTVLFDPGRIKRGVLPRDEAGTALTEGGEYTLVIDATWPDQHGAPLVADFRKTFRVVPEARNGIDLKTWKLQPPAASASPLLVDFPAPLDYALLNRLLDVHSSTGRVEGKVILARHETQWQFLPDTPWAAAAYKLQVDTALEDVAGNRVGRPFDVDVFEPITTKMSRKYESIPFHVIASGSKL
jgi:hypothetical protein